MLKSVNAIPTSERLFKTKPCTTMCDTGVCLRAKCNFAHSADELRHPLCAFGNSCNKLGCGFFHPMETIESFRARTNFVMPSFEKKFIEPTNQDQDEDDNVDVIINILQENIERRYPYIPTSLEPVKIDSNHEMSEIWAQIAVWNRRDIQWH